MQHYFWKRGRDVYQNRCTYLDYSYIPKKILIHFALEYSCNIFCILHRVKCILHRVEESRSLEILFLKGEKLAAILPSTAIEK